jgi:2-desacetyl-2-hydroxyethyl bacteriochlorophyllide A dehydrogenase
MKAIMLSEPRQIGVVDLPDEQPGPGEVTLRIESCSVCGSDLEGFHGIHPKMTFPRVMGHEVGSVVKAVGDGVGLSVGDRVAGTGRKACRSCEPCRNGRPAECANPGGPGFTAHGAYAESMTVIATELVPIPENLSFDEAAVAQPAAIAYHAVVGRAAIKEGETVLIQGCGPIGLSAMMLAKLQGARVISTDIVDYRVQKARELGAELALNSSKEDVFAPIRDMTSGQGVDKVIECVGADQDETIPQAVEAVRSSGLVVVVGSFASNRATVPIIDFKFSEKSLIGSQGMPEGYGPIFELMSFGKLDVNRLISHRIPLDQAPHALSLMDRKDEDVLKVVLKPQT